MLTGRDHLAARVTRERARLGWSQPELARRAQRSARTIRLVEAGGRVSDETLEQIEAALRWAPGSIAAVLAGGEPTPDLDADLARIVAAWPTLDARGRAVLVAVLEVLAAQS